jgi:threonine dehydratase
LTLIHPFEDRDVIFGQGTVALEILEQEPQVETIIVPIGGGGLAAGVVLAVKALRKDVRVVGVQAEGAAAMAESLRTSRLVAIDAPSTIAEGIRVGAPGELCFHILREHLDDVVTVGESQIAEAMVQTLAKSKVVPEAAGVAAVAALTSGALAAQGSICAVVSGGNIDLHLLGRLIESGLAAQGFYHLTKVRLRDGPGELHRILGVLARSNCNVLDVQHYRAGWKVPVGFVDVEILLETRFDGQGAEIDELLRRAAGTAPA